MTSTLKILASCALALLLLDGCSGCNKKKPGATPGAAAGKAGPFDTLDLPGDIFAYGGVANPRALAQQVAGVASGAAPAGGALPQVLESGLPRALGLSSAAGLALDRPMRFALLDPEANRGHEAMLLITVPSRKRFEETLPAGHKKDDQGNAYAVQARSGRVYFNFLGETLVATRDPGQFKAHHAALEKLAAAAPPEGLALVVPVDKVRSRKKADIDRAIARIEEAKGAEGPARELAGKLAAAMRRAVEDTSRAVMRLTAPGGSARLEVEVRLAEGSKLAAAVARLPAKGKLELLHRLPADAPAFAAVNVAPGPLADLAGELIGKLFSMGIVKQVGLDASYGEAAVKLLRATTGQAVQAVIPEAGGVALTGAFGVADAPAARAALATMLDAYGSGAAKAAYAEQGVDVAVERDAYKVGEVPVSTMSMTFTRLGGKTLGKMLSQFTKTHIAVADDLAVFAYGDRGRATLSRLVGGQEKGGLDQTPGVKQAVDLAGPGALLLIYASASDLAGLFGPPGSPKPAKPNASPGLVVAAGVRGDALRLVVDLPGEQVRAVGQLVQRVLMQLGGAFMRTR